MKWWVETLAYDPGKKEGIYFDYLSGAVAAYTTAELEVSGLIPGSNQMIVRSANICFRNMGVFHEWHSCLIPTIQALLRLGLDDVVV